jgi:hypothetical protein
MAGDPDSPKVLVSVRNEIEAVGIVTALAARGISASTTGGFTAGFRAEAPGYIQVIVKEADLDQARQALAEIRKEREEIDWSQIDVGEPDDP